MPTLEPDLLSRLLPSYNKARQEDLRKMLAAVESADFRLLEKIAHKIKGSAGTYGFPLTAETALRLQNAARAQVIEACTVYIRQMQDSLFQA